MSTSRSGRELDSVSGSGESELVDDSDLAHCAVSVARRSRRTSAARRRREDDAHIGGSRSNDPMSED
jgi:hypothetical protein